MDSDFLKNIKVKGSDGQNLDEHLVQVLKYMVAHQPDSPLSYFYQVSNFVAGGKFIPDKMLSKYLPKEKLHPPPYAYTGIQDEIEKQNEYRFAENYLKLHGIDSVIIPDQVEEEEVKKTEEDGEDEGEEDEEEGEGEEEEDLSEPAVQDVLNDLRLIKQSGVGLTDDEIFKIYISMNLLQEERKFKSLRFFGKIRGLKKDYYVVEALAGKGEEEGEDEAEEEEEGEEEEAKLTYEELIQGKIPVEKDTGVNKYKYFICTSLDGAQLLTREEIAGKEGKSKEFFLLPEKPEPVEEVVEEEKVGEGEEKKGEGEEGEGEGEEKEGEGEGGEEEGESDEEEEEEGEEGEEEGEEKEGEGENEGEGEEGDGEENEGEEGVGEGGEPKEEAPPEIPEPKILEQIWTQLPDVKPSQLILTRGIHQYFQGDLDAPVECHPPFNGKERDYLRCQIARIASSTVLAPNGLFKIDKGEEEDEEEEDEDEEEGEKKKEDEKEEQIDAYTTLPTIEAVEEFKSSEAFKELKLDDLKNWVHLYFPVLQQQARCVSLHKEKNDDEDAEDEEEEEEEGEGGEKKEEIPIPIEKIWPILSSVDNDMALSGDTKAWSIRPVMPEIEGDKYVCLRSNRWPGARVVGKKGSGMVQKESIQFSSVYVGDGLKFREDRYAPPIMSLTIDEMFGGSEMTVHTDPSREEYTNYDFVKGSIEEEGEGEEEED